VARRLISAFLLAGAILTAARPEDGPRAGQRDLARARDFSLGAAVDVSALEQDPDYRETLAREFNLVVAENAFKFENIQPGRGRYQFAPAAALVDFAERHGMKLRGHTLVWHRQLPRWLTEGQFTRDEVAAILKEHMTTLVSRYRGRVWAWDVVKSARRPLTETG
jgi:endo-1,4-beta-xylanase